MPGGVGLFRAPDAVEGVDEGLVAPEQRVERRQRLRRGGPRARVRALGEGAGALERIGELGHALGREAAVHHQVDTLARRAEQHIDVGRGEAAIRAPEAARKQGENERSLDARPPGAYHPAPRSGMPTVPRLPRPYLEKLLASSPDIIVAADRKGTIIFYNDGARSTLCYTPDEVLGQHVSRLYPDLAEARKVMSAMRAGYGEPPGQAKNYETVFVTKNGTRVPVAISGGITRDDQGAEVGSVGFAKDLRDIRRHDQLALLGEVAVSLAHEINNPLEVIVNNLNLLEGHVAKVSSDADFIVESERLDSIHAALGRIQGIVSKLSELAQGAEYATREYLPGTQMT
ncbi:MAG: PAS domain S-box protein, partial [Deltaproteobacteria bacterium]